MTTPEFVGLRAQGLVIKRLQPLFHRIDLLYGLSVVLQHALVTTTEKIGQEIGHTLLLRTTKPRILRLGTMYFKRCIIIDARSGRKVQQLGI